jgi:hypothetical protein
VLLRRGVDYRIALVRLYVFDSAFRATVIAAAIPNISPFFSVFGAAIIIHELSFRHSVLLIRGSCAALSCNAVSMI